MQKIQNLDAACKQAKKDAGKVPDALMKMLEDEKKLYLRYGVIAARAKG